MRKKIFLFLGIVAVILVDFNFAQAVDFPNPLGVTTVCQVVQKVLTYLQGIVGALAILFIVLGGIFYMLSAGNETMVKRAKLCWTGAVIGLAIALAAPTFLREILQILGGQGGDCSGVATAGGSSLKDIIGRALNLLLSIIGIIAIISLVIAGGMYLTSYGDETRIDAAKKMATYAVIGIVIALGALVIVNQVVSIIGG
jgi:type IV secretory pathway VirB2 component (pilin)